jgi:putative ABC transport system permease protein
MVVLILILIVILGPALAILITFGLQVLGILKGVPFSYNLRNLVVRWRTTLLTALAFTLVVGLMMVMLAFVNGMYKLTEGSGVPANVMVMSEGSTDELFSNLAFTDISALYSWQGVVKDIDGRPLVSKETYIVCNQPIPNAVKGGRQRRFLQIRGIEEPDRAGRVHNLALHDGGQWFDASGVERVGAKESILGYIQVVLGEGIARELGRDLGKPTLAVGDAFVMRDRNWVVKGILKSGGSTFDSEIWSRYQQVGPLFGKNVYTTIVLRAEDAAAARSLTSDLTANYREAAVQCQVETEYYERLNTTNQQFLVAIIFVAIIMAIGGVFGVMNTMFAAISQRLKDIGVLRILGYARWQILVSFFMEALLLALIGGLIGCAIGSLANGHTATSIISSGQGGGGKSVVLKMVVDARIVFTGLLFSLGMGCVGGLLPALSAMRLKPLDAVR